MKMTVNTPFETRSTVTESKTPIYSIDGQRLKRLIEASLQWLKANQQIVNSLNVFPVPDGDTGTNMLLTMQAAFNEIAQSDENNIGKIAKDIAQGALMGARGDLSLGADLKLRLAGEWAHRTALEMIFMMVGS